MCLCDMANGPMEKRILDKAHSVVKILTQGKQHEEATHELIFD